MRREVVTVAAVLLALAGARARGDMLTPVDGKPFEATVVEVTEKGVTVAADTGRKTYAFDDLEAECAVGYLRRTVDLDTADGRITLGKYCLKRRRVAEGRAELLEAKRLDPKRDNEINQIWAEMKPPEAKAELTTEEFERTVEEQRSRRAAVEKALGTTVTTLETDHFVIHTTFPRPDHKLLMKLCEKLYAGFDGIFEMTKNGDRMWDGKCVMYFFGERRDFVKFAQEVHGFPGQVGDGYFRSRGNQCEVVIPNLRGLEPFKETMVHEGAHAFLHFYREPGRVPTWVHEGVAQYFQFEEFPKSPMLRAVKHTLSEDVKAGRILKLKNLAASRRPAAGDYEGYAYAYSYISYMIYKKPKQFKAFIGGLKRGLEAEEALKEAYEWDFDAMQESWLKAVSRRR